ncbi:MAG: formate dehydrogenase subunit alpha [Rhodospirillales bacterium]|nr:formate dehydrogenase subunit alpha [Rhodospirillales bacterium]
MGPTPARGPGGCHARRVDLRSGPGRAQRLHVAVAALSGGVGVSVEFTLDGRAVVAEPGETIWQVAKRSGLAIPHLCHCDRPGYRPDGNCRACVVEIEGERTLAASCVRQPTAGMVVRTAGERVEKARRMVFELLVADQPEPPPDSTSAFNGWAERLGVRASRFVRSEPSPAADRSHVAIAVRRDACIHCGLCIRACREIQGNDVLGMARRGRRSQIAFDLDDPLGASRCVACGECVEVCPTGALLEAGLVDGRGIRSIWADRSVASVCPYCGVGCQLTFHVRGNQLIAVDGADGPANRGRLCVKGRFGFDYVHHPHRLTKPLIRKAGVPKRGDELVDPANPHTHFREASWEEALELAAGGLRRIRDRRGSQALAGFGSAKGSNEEAYLFQKLVRVGFGTNNVDHCTRLCHASSVAALMENIGSGAVTAPFEECLNSEVILVIGCNPTVNHPVAGTFIKNAVAKGAQLVVMDPRGAQGLTRHAALELAFRPGSDVALINALMHVIVTEGLHDPAYIAEHTIGFAELRDHLAGYAPEAMAGICGIAPGTIRAVARLYAKARSAMLFWGMGVAQHVHGTDNARCLISLALLCGHIGKPGSGLHPLRGQNNVQGASDVGLIPMVYPEYRSVEKADVRGFFEDYWGAKLDPRRGLTVVEILNAAFEGRITGMYIMGENPAMSDPDLAHARAALASLEHLVVQDIFLTETAFHADVILPASAFPEKTGTFTNTDRRVQLGRQAIDPPGDARQDWWIVQEMARAIGLDWRYGGPADVYAEMRGCMPSLRGISWQRLERESCVTHPCTDEHSPGQAILFATGFPTPMGKARFTPAGFLPPDDLPDPEFPLVLTTGRILEHWHTGAMTRRAARLDAIEPVATVQLSPALLARVGVTAGGLVRILTRRGEIIAATRAVQGMPEELVFMPFCYAEAAANLLTNPALDPDGKIPELKYCAVRVEAAEN